jgi:hypothetical protein
VAPKWYKQSSIHILGKRSAQEEKKGPCSNQRTVNSKTSARRKTKEKNKINSSNQSTQELKEL